MLSHVTEFSPDQLGAIESLIEAATTPGVMYPPRGETWAPDHDADDPYAGQIMDDEMVRLKEDWLEERDSWRWFEANPGPDVVLPPPDEWAAIRADMPELSSEEWAAIRARRKKKDEAEEALSMRDEKVADIDVEVAEPEPVEVDVVDDVDVERSDLLESGEPPRKTDAGRRKFNALQRKLEDAGVFKAPADNPDRTLSEMELATAWMEREEAERYLHADGPRVEAVFKRSMARGIARDLQEHRG